MSKDCEVRFIITINALKEGWDCPFAYILASLADKSSAVDVEQILGRVLRQPYVMKHKLPLLNLSYVLTASSKFLDTLDNIVKGLNKAGFSERDYKLLDPSSLEQEQNQDPLQQLNVFSKVKPEQTESIIDDIDASRISIPTDNEIESATVSEIENLALAQTKAFEKTVHEIENNNLTVLPNEIKQLVKTYSIKTVFKEQAEQINLPQFYLKIPKNDLFGNAQSELPLDKENLLEGFALSKSDTNIAFDSIHLITAIQSGFRRNKERSHAHFLKD